MRSTEDLDARIGRAIEAHARSERAYDELLESWGLGRDAIARAAAGGHLSQRDRVLLSRAIVELGLDEEEGGGPAPPAAVPALPPRALAV